MRERLELNFDISSTAGFAALRWCESPWLQDCRIRFECSFQLLRTHSSVIGNTIRRKPRSEESLALLFMQSIFSSLIHDQDAASPLTANLRRTSNLFCGRYRWQPAVAADHKYSFPFRVNHRGRRVTRRMFLCERSVVWPDSQTNLPALTIQGTELHGENSCRLTPDQVPPMLGEK
jgi:hypothetical protein